MDTTLVTFYLKTSTDVCSVELLGSWDNFARPYRLTRDTLRGYGSWTGNYKFENIIFDGDRLDWRKPRTGGLKQGGRYWYYYRLDDDEEYCDSAQPTATDCPLLPGQTTNVIDVPREIIQPPSRSRSASADFVSFCPQIMTLDPEDRYKKVEKPAPTKLPRHYVSTEALQPHAIQTQAEASLPSSSASAGSQPRSSASGESWSDYSTGYGNSWTSSPLQEDAPSSSSPMRRWRSKLPKLRRFGAAATETSPERPSTRSGTCSSSEGSFESLAAFPMPPMNRRQPTEVLEALLSLDAEPQHIVSQQAGLGIDVGCNDAHNKTTPQPTHEYGSQNSFYPERTSSRMPPPTVPQSWQSRTGKETPSVAFLDRSPYTEASASNINSPTFTADTISTSGFHSPERLSQQYALGGYQTSHEPTILEQDLSGFSHSIEDVTDQLHYLHTGDESVYTTPRTNPFVDHYFLIPNSILANPVASSSQITLKRPSTLSTATPISLNVVPTKSSDVRKDSVNDDSSLSDAIFDELSYLTHVIN